MTEIKEYYKYGKDGEICHKNGRHIINVIKELNELEHYRQHHKKERTRLEKENELLWDIYDGIIAYFKLQGRLYEWKKTAQNAYTTATTI